MTAVYLSGPSVYGSFEKLEVRQLHEQLMTIRNLLHALENQPDYRLGIALELWRGSAGYLAKCGLAAAKVLRSRHVPYNRMGMDPVAYFTRKCEEHAAEQAAPDWLRSAFELGDCPYFRSVRLHLIKTNPNRFRKFWPKEEGEFTGFAWPVEREL